MLLLFLCVCEPAWAQAKNPFSVGISEGGGSANGLTGWLLAQQGLFERRLSQSVRAAKTDGTALWSLVGLSLTYGVFHAAGPGHGKAVLASYMVANERALRRGVVLSFLAALLQGLVAIALVGVLALVLHATAQRMKDSAALVETLSFAGIACLGAVLVWRKGQRLLGLLRLPRTYGLPAIAGAPTFFAPMPMMQAPGAGAVSLGATGEASRFVCVPAEALHPLDCVHCHGPDPAMLTGVAFSRREALLTVFAAGSRPCSGAILVLVFALAQGLFAAGVASVLAMSFGVAVTTAALASVAVFAKTVAHRMTRPGSRTAILVMASLELAAACLVLIAGVSLLTGSVTGGA